MCGIAGILDTRGEGVDAGILERMIGTVRHRGPDEVGVRTDQSLGLAHARLSIIDIDGGRQPMSIDDGRLWIAFNGEVFNFVELRAELEAKGHRFRTRSDTEVILRLYADRGDAFVDALEGQWALAIWDARRRRLVLSRDPVGIVPLHWTRVGPELVFGSELKTLLAHPRVERRLDLEALDEVFTFWAPVAPRTLLQGISEVPPGHQLVVDADGRVTEHRYFAFEPHPELSISDADDAAAELMNRLTDATRIRLRADVPVGAYLSGGLDSSVVTALATQVRGAPPATFSVTFADREFDEAPYQTEMVEHLGTEHTSVAIDEGDIARVFPDVVWHGEKPILRTAPAPLFLLSERVHALGYKVVLTGEGSDEFLGGYDIFKEAKVRAFWAAMPESTVRPRLLSRLYPYLPRIQAQSPAFLMAFFQVSPGASADPFFSHLPRWQLTSRVKALFSDAVRGALEGHDPVAKLAERVPRDFGRWDPFFRAQWLEATMLMPGYILSSQGDRMAMSHAVEGRFPFLDRRVIDLSSRLPSKLKMRGLDEKHVLKRAAAGLIPDTVRRRKKQPYRAPDARSFFGPGAPAWVAELVSEPRLREAGIFDPRAVAHLVEKARAGRVAGARDNMALVGVLSTQLFHTQFVANAGRRFDGAD